MIIQQKSFSAGLDLLSSDTRIAEDGYVWLINARNRFGTVDPISKHVELSPPSGLIQGCFSVGDTLIIFVAGRAYTLTEGSNAWILVPSFQLDSTVPIIYTEAVPASTFNFVRTLNPETQNINDPIRIRIPADFTINGTPSAVVCQDGINQPWLIIYDSTNRIFYSRVSGNYSSWMNETSEGTDREYVPIGLNMMYSSGKLYIVAPDRKSIYHSITGRPLDFMINVDVDGNKLPDENEGGADTVSFAFDFDDITCIQRLNLEDSFLYATAKTSRIIIPNYGNIIFGEPTFKCAATLKAGVANQFSFADALNDFVSVDQQGIKSFNATQQLKIKSNSSIFSLQLSKLLYNSSTRKPIKQQYCSVYPFDSYLLFNLDTCWGNLIAVYDLIKSGWAALDITAVTRVKQYATTETVNYTTIYCVTYDNKVFRMFSGTTTELAQIRSRGFVTQETDIEHKSQYVRCMFDGGTFNGSAELIEYVDEQESVNTRTSKDLKVALGGVIYPVRPPVIPSTEQRIENVSFPLVNGLVGKKIHFILQWNNDAKLVEFQLSTSEKQNMNSFREQNLVYS